MPYTQNILSKNDPDPVTVINNTGNIIITSPHNGCAVPKCLKPYLGTNKTWFNQAHEAMDLHIDKLFIALSNRLNEVSFISGNYSRLVCDLNALPDYSIKNYSSEYRHIEISENCPKICCAKQKISRLNEIYWPYHDKKKQLIEDKREIHGGVIVLDIHSFSPTWEQKNRNVEIGTIRCEKTPLSRAFEKFLREEQSDFTFVSGEPYRVEDIPTNAAPMITDRNDLQYLGLEIRNDLILNESGILKITALIENAINHITSHTDIDNISMNRSSAMPQNTKQPTAPSSWSI